MHRFWPDRNVAEQLKRMPDANNLRWRKPAKAKLTMLANEKVATEPETETVTWNNKRGGKKGTNKKRNQEML